MWKQASDDHITDIAGHTADRTWHVTDNTDLCSAAHASRIYLKDKLTTFLPNTSILIFPLFTEKQTSGIVE